MRLENLIYQNNLFIISTARESSILDTTLNHILYIYMYIYIYIYIYTQDREFVSIIVDLENLDSNIEANAEVTKTGQIEKEVSFSELCLNQLETEQTNSSKMETTPPTLCTNSSEFQNSSCSLVESNETEIFLLRIENLFPF